MGGFGFLRDGLRLALQPGIRAYVFLPLTINTLLFGILLYWGYSQTEYWQQQLVNAIPTWLQWLQWLIKPAFYLTAALFLFYGFSTVANFIAAPFNGLLAEQIEAQLDPNINPPDFSIAALLALVPRSLAREIQKLLYYLPRMLAIFLLGFIAPGVNVIIWFGFNAWMMSLQYLDYPIDNNRQSFAQVKRFAWRHKADSFSFGTGVMLLTMVPLLNLFIMPVAVCAATKMWVAHKPRA